MVPNSPLNDEHRKCLDTTLQGCQAGLELARACQDCGLDMSEQISVLKQQQDMATKMKSKFFPYSP